MPGAGRDASKSSCRFLKSPTIWTAILALADRGNRGGAAQFTRSSVLGFMRSSGTSPTRNPGKQSPRSICGSTRCPAFDPLRPCRPPAVRIADGDEVIGVVVNGKPRAYWLKALRYPPWHIVNDVVVGVPVSVTHCDRTDCTRVYTGRPSSTPLDINLAGLFGSEMVVNVDGVLYFQESGKPFEARAGAPSLPYARFIPVSGRPGRNGSSGIPKPTCLSVLEEAAQNPEDSVSITPNRGLSRMDRSSRSFVAWSRNCRLAAPS